MIIIYLALGLNWDKRLFNIIIIAAIYLIVSRIITAFLVSFFTGGSLKNTDTAEVLLPVVTEVFLVYLLLRLLIYQPLIWASDWGLKLRSTLEERKVARIALESQRKAYQLRLAQFGLVPEDIPSYVKDDDLMDYINVQRELGLVADPVNLEEIRRKVRGNS